MLRRRTPLGTPHLSPDVVAELSEMAQAALPLETGGILLGWYEHHDIRITDAIAVEDPAATATSYSRGNEAGNAALAAYTIQQELDPESPNGLRAVYGVYLLDTRQIWAPRGVLQHWRELRQSQAERALGAVASGPAKD